MKTTMIGLKSDIRALRPLNYIAKWIAILPHFDSEKYECCISYIYAVISILIFLTISVISTYGKITGLQHLETTTYYMAIATDLALIVAIIVSIFGVNLVQGLNVCKFLQTLLGIDEEFVVVNSENKSPCIGIYVELLIGHILFVLYYIYNNYIWINAYGLKLAKYFIVRDFQYYHMIILALLVRMYARAIENRLETMNDILLRIGTNDNIVVTIKDDIWDIRRLMKVHSNLAEATNLYNSIFGWQFITLYTWICMNILASINLILVYGTGNNYLLGYTFGLEILSLCVIWVVIPLIIIVGIVNACNKAAEEAIKTCDICYTKINEISNDEKKKQLKEDLLEFAGQSTAKCPKFVSPGFIPINYNVLYTMIGSITSYLIVLIQFHK